MKVTFSTQSESFHFSIHLIHIEGGERCLYYVKVFFPVGLLGKRYFYSENALNVFRPHTATGKKFKNAPINGHLNLDLCL